MNNQNISKLKFIFLGLTNRFNEDNSLFKGINIEYKAGLKSFKGVGLYNSNKIDFTFNGVKEILTIDELFDNICIEASKYDSLTVIYEERGTSTIITGDNKNVKMVSKEATPFVSSENHGAGSSTLLNRKYLIQVGNANSLLKAIGIMSNDGKILNNKIRKYNQIDHYVELIDKALDTLSSEETLTILDCGCGKSYLSFVLNYYLTEVKK